MNPRRGSRITDPAADSSQLWARIVPDVNKQIRSEYRFFKERPVSDVAVAIARVKWHVNPPIRLKDLQKFLGPFYPTTPRHSGGRLEFRLEAEGYIPPPARRWELRIEVEGKPWFAAPFFSISYGGPGIRPEEGGAAILKTVHTVPEFLVVPANTHIELICSGPSFRPIDPRTFEITVAIEIAAVAGAAALLIPA